MLNGLYPSIVIILIFVLFFGYKFLKGSISILYYFYWIIFGVYISGLIVYTLFPFPYQKLLIQTMIEEKLGLHYNLIPFKSVVDAIKFGYFSVGLRQIGGNVLLFIPLGFALPILFSNIKHRHVFIIGFAVSLTIETIQAVAGYFIGYNYRAFDIDDLILNTFGTFLGLIIFKLLYKFIIRSPLLSNN